jgi:predicted ATPase/DNA-binding SARP family transcriptional activator/Flp pilus assembly protein TadD
VKPLRLHLLGRPEVYLGDDRVEAFASDKTLALLCYLAVRGGQHARASLAGLFWAEMPADRARANLRTAVYNLQKLLPGYLQASRNEVALKPQEPGWLDTEMFELQIKQALNTAGAGSIGEGVYDFSALQQAVVYYRGEFLEGLYLDEADVFYEWTVVERERLHQLAVRALQLLAERWQANQDYAQALEASQRLLALDPWQESAHRLVMLLLARTGDYTAALSQYERCRRLLGEGMGVDPMPETTDLFERIKAVRARPVRQNLPSQATAFIGRESELENLDARFREPSGRLVVIVGPGGVGKTRLALEAAARQLDSFLEGVFFISLAALDSPDEIATTILAALSVPVQPSEPAETQLINYLGQKEILLVMDNFEHLVSGTVLLARILEAAAGVRFLVTSRERLNLHWETVFPLGGLRVPEGAVGVAFEQYSAVRLFLEARRRSEPQYSLSEGEGEDVAALCRQVEGLPLAIELAAASVMSMPLAAVVAGIQQNLDSLVTSFPDVPPRHRSLRASIDHSWQLLEKGQQQVFMQLSIFHGPFSIEAAEAVAGAAPPVLVSLVAKSLLRLAGQGRYEVHEMLRQYGLEKLVSSDGLVDEIGDRHSAFYLYALSQREEAITGPERARTIEDIRIEIDNVRAAWRHAVDRQRMDLLAMAVKSLGQFLSITAPAEEGEALFRIAVEMGEGQLQLETTPDEEVQLLVVALLIRQARFLVTLSRYEKAGVALGKAGELVGSQEGGGPVVPRAELEAEIHLQWGWMCERQGDNQTAETHYQRTLDLARAAGLRRLEGTSINSLGIVVGDRGEYAEAENRFRTAAQIARSIGDLQGETNALHNLSIAAIYQNRFTEAEEILARELGLYREMGLRRNEGFALLALCILSNHFGDATELETRSQQALQICHEIGERREISQALRYLGLAALYQGRLEEAAIHIQQAVHNCQAEGDRYHEGEARLSLGQVYRHLGDYPAARVEWEKALGTVREIQARREECLLLCQLSLLAEEQGDLEDAREEAQNGLDLAIQLGAPVLKAQALTALGYSLAGSGEMSAAREAYLEALNIRRQYGQDHLAAENLAGLARITLSQDDQDSARAYGGEILAGLLEGGLVGIEQPGRVALICYQALKTAGDPRAISALEAAHAWLYARYEKIWNPAWRAAFLQSIATHREISQAWQDLLASDPP